MVAWEQALQGEDVVISKAGKPLVRLAPYEEAPEPIKISLMKGQIRIFESGIREWPYRSSDTRKLESLPYHHKDPFDRMIIASAASAAAENFIVVTADKIFERYPIEVRIVP